MHKDTVYGEVNLRKVKRVSLKESLTNPQRIVDKKFKLKVQELLHTGYSYKNIQKYFETHKEEWIGMDLKKIEVYYFTKETKDRFFATRKSIDTSFNQKKIENEVTDTGIQKILMAHLLRNNNDANIAFSPDGIEEMNKNIQSLNGGKSHQPIYKVRVYEKADKFAIGERGNKSTKFVEAAKGTNLFFAVYKQEILDKETGKTIQKRTYSSLPLNQVIERQKKGLLSAPEDKNGNTPIFVLSPNDLVYLPTEEEIKEGKLTIPLNKNRIYKMVSCTGNRLFAIPNNVASIILDKIEYSSMNKVELTDEKESIKELCIPLKIDRLGNIALPQSL